MPLLDGIASAYLRMSKYISKSARKRVPLHAKMAGKGFYKGNRCAPTGRITSKGKKFLCMCFGYIYFLP
jgi:large subunit ribosomal protein L41